MVDLSGLGRRVGLNPDTRPWDMLVHIHCTTVHLIVAHLKVELVVLI